MSRTSSSGKGGSTGISIAFLAVFAMLLCVAFSLYYFLIHDPGKIELELDAVWQEVSDIMPISRRKAEFSNRIADRTMDYDSSAFVGDAYVVWYTDTLALPGVPVFRRLFRIERPMEGDSL